MAVQAYNCPSCGAPLTIENRFSKIVICSYCGQTSTIKEEGLDPSGQKAKLADFPSVFSLGMSGLMKGEQFKVLARIRYKYDGGFWDEWFLNFENGKKVWLQEDEGKFTTFEKENLMTSLPPFSDITVGTSLEINGKSTFIVEKNEAEIAGGEGELYFEITPGETLQYVDGNAEGQMISIEFSDSEIELFLGEKVALQDLVIQK